jgi:hypothetical protein
MSCEIFAELTIDSRAPIAFAIIAARSSAR